MRPYAKATVTFQISDKGDQGETRRPDFDEQRKEQKNDRQRISAAGVWFDANREIVLLLNGCGGAPASVVVEGIQVQVLSANTGGSAPMGDDEINPDNFSGRRFLVGVMIEGGELVGREAVWDWAIDNIRLVYDDEEYEVITVGMEFDQGSFVGDILSFTVPKDSEFARYTLQVADQVSIDLGSFFE